MDDVKWNEQLPGIYKNSLHQHQRRRKGQKMCVKAAAISCHPVETHKKDRNS